MRWEIGCEVRLGEIGNTKYWKSSRRLSTLWKVDLFQMRLWKWLSIKF